MTDKTARITLARYTAGGRAAADFTIIMANKTTCIVVGACNITGG